MFIEETTHAYFAFNTFLIICLFLLNLSSETLDAVTENLLVKGVVIVSCFMQALHGETLNGRHRHRNRLKRR